MIKELIGLTVYDKSKISLKDFDCLQKIAEHHLGIQGIYKLKDRHEDVHYFNQFLMRSYAEIALQNYLGEMYFRVEDKRDRNFVPEIIYQGQTLHIVVSSMDDYPKIPRIDCDKMVFCFVNIDKREVWIMGMAGLKEIVPRIDSNNISPLYKKSYYGMLKELDFLVDIR